MAKTSLENFRTLADGWVAGKFCPKGTKLSLTPAQAKYENVAPWDDGEPAVELVGSLDDPTVKSSGLKKAADEETAKRRRSRK